MRIRAASAASERWGRSGSHERCRRKGFAWPRLLLLAGLISATGCIIAPARGVRFMRIAGATEVVQVSEAGLDFIARVDSGSTNTSLHALDLQIEGEAESPGANVGKQIHFRTVNGQGEMRQLDGRIAGVFRVRNAQGTEIRYAVPLHLVWKGSHRRVLVNLRDRSEMDYKLLVGRDWIHGNVLIDVERNVEE